MFLALDAFDNTATLITIYLIERRKLFLIHILRLSLADQRNICM